MQSRGTKARPQHLLNVDLEKSPGWRAEASMESIIYLVGLVVVVMVILSVLGLR